MEDIQNGDGDVFFAKTAIEAPEINITASGTSSDGNDNATFKALSHYGGDATIDLKAGDRLTVNYRDALDKEKKQDLFYAQGNKAAITIDASFIDINNDYNQKGNSADLRNVFFADDGANISVTGQARIVGNTTAREGGTVVLDVKKGSSITGGMMDNSYPYYDSTTDGINPFPDKGSITLTGSEGSVWNVLPYIDSADRGSIWSKETIHSTVDTISGGTSTEADPFRINLTGSALPGYYNKPFSYQSVNVGHLNRDGFVQFDLRFTDEKENGINKRDTVRIHQGEGTHGVYVDYRGAHDASEAESLRNAWLVSDSSKGASFKLMNEGEKVDIGIWKYELASEPGQSNLGEDGEAMYWYLKRAGASGGTDEPPLTPGADTLVSLAGSQRYLHWADLQDLRKRLGEVRYGSQDGLWARVITQKDRTDGVGGESGLEQNYRGLNFGFDRFARDYEEKMWLLGASFSFGNAEQETRRNNHGRGETDRYGLNLYATWANNNGSYADFVLSGDYFQQEMTTRANDMLQKGDYNTWGAGLSAEIGHQFTSERKDVAWGPWYRHSWVEPQVQLSYYMLKGQDYHLSNRGIRVSQNDEDSLIARVGVVLGTRWNYSEDYEAIDKRFVQVWLKGGLKHDFLGDYRVALNDVVFSNDIGKTTFYYGLGADWQVSDHTRFYLQAERETGSHYTKEYEFSAGLKYSF